MGPNFSPVLAFTGTEVIAMGPLGQDDFGKPDFVEDVRAWVYQSSSVQANVPSDPPTNLLVWSPDDAAAADDGLDPDLVRQNPGVCWMRRLPTITSTTFKTGRAFAVAIALIRNGGNPVSSPLSQLRGRVVWWGHPVWITSDPNAVDRVEQIFDLLEQDDKSAIDPDYFVKLTSDLEKELNKVLQQPS
jgi:hypothetical protein